MSVCLLHNYLLSLLNCELCTNASWHLTWFFTTCTACVCVEDALKSVCISMRKNLQYNKNRHDHSCISLVNGFFLKSFIFLQHDYWSPSKWYIPIQVAIAKTLEAFITQFDFYSNKTLPFWTIYRLGLSIVPRNCIGAVYVCKHQEPMYSQTVALSTLHKISFFRKKLPFYCHFQIAFDMFTFSHLHKDSHWIAKWFLVRTLFAMLR